MKCSHGMPAHKCSFCSVVTDEPDEGPRRVQSCEICALPPSACLSSQRLVAADQRHEYTPGMWVTLR